MAHPEFGVTERELESLASACRREADELRIELNQRPWAIYELLADPAVVTAVLEPTSIADTPDPFALFAVLVRLAADELLRSTHVNDWIGPRCRLPVYDVEPVQEFVCAPGRVLFVVRLLTSMVAPGALPVPVPGSDPWQIVDWLDAVDDRDRCLLLRRLGDLALFLAGVQADAHGDDVLTPALAAKVGRTLGMTSDEVLELADPGSISPGLDALERLGARWYQAAIDSRPDTAPVVADVARRMHAARRFLNHLSDTYLAPLVPNWNLAA